MGRKHKWNEKYEGVNYQSKSSLRLNFSYKSQQQFQTYECDPDQEQSWQVAAEIVVDIKRDIRDGAFDYKRWFPESKKSKKYAPTRGAFLKDYLPYYNELRKKGIQRMGKGKPLAASSYESNRSTIVGILTPAFGNICVDELAAEDIYKWGEEYCKNVTTNTLSNIITVLRVALDFAVLEKLIPLNPLIGITLYGHKKSIKIDKHDPFDREEMHALLLAAETTEFVNYLRFAFFTGLRPSEQIALTWSDYNSKLRTIRVDKSLTDVDEVATDVKTPASDRTIHLSPTAIYALDCQKMHTKLKGGEIFQNPFDQKSWVGSRPIRDRFILLCRDAGVRYRKPYQTRHTYASMQLTVNENPAFISEQMGHTDVSFTLRTYASYIQRHRSDAGWLADSEFTDLPIDKQNLLVLSK